MKGKKIVVTGGAGFIGSHIVKELVSLGADVKVIDSLFAFSHKKEEEKLANLSGVIDKIEFILGDIGDYTLLKETFKGADYLCHQAARRCVPASIESPQKYAEVNVLGTMNVLKAALENNVNRLVFASSSSVYGDAPLPLIEGREKEPKSPYALTKKQCEDWLKLFHSVYGLETVSLRYFNVFGPYQDPTSKYAVVIPLFTTAVMNGSPPTIYGNGNQTRDFTYIQNVVDANIQALTAPAEKVAGEIFNIANGESISVNKLLYEINRILSKDIKPIYTAERKGDVMHTLADNTKAKQVLGYNGDCSFKDGLKKTVEWFRNHPTTFPQ